MSGAKKAQLVHLSRLLREAADAIDTLAADQPQPTELKKIYEALDWAGFPVQADVDKATEEDFLSSIQLLSRSRESILHNYEAVKVELAKLRETVDLAIRKLTYFGFGSRHDMKANAGQLAEAISSMRAAHLATIEAQEKRVVEHRNRADELRVREKNLEEELERMKTGLRNLITDNSK